MDSLILCGWGGKIVGRFDRDETGNEVTNGDTEGREETTLPPVPWTVGSTTEKVRSMLQRHVREIIDDAGARAAAIESRALAKANEMEQESQRKENKIRESEESIRETLGSALQRAEAILHGTEALHAELGKVIDSFKAEIENLTTELQRARDTLTPVMPDQVESPVALPEPPPAPEPSPRPEPPPAPQPIAEEAPPAQEEPATQEEPAAQEEESEVVAQEEAALEEEPAKRRRRGLLRRD
jgi:hypothetical protein